DSNDDNYRLMEKLEALTIKMDSQFQSLKEEMNEIRDVNRVSKNDDMPMCERRYIQYEELNNDVKNDLEDFKRCIRSMRTIHDQLFDRDDGKTTGVLPNKKSQPINQEP
ncbi:hypothetical protein Tco_1581481, partial [Tanacetum coccineum]